MRYAVWAILLTACGVAAQAAEDADIKSDLTEIQAMRRVRGQALEQETTVRMREAHDLLATDVSATYVL